MAIAINVLANDIFTNERVDVPSTNSRQIGTRRRAENSSHTKVAVNFADFPLLTRQQAEICTRLHCTQSEFLEAQARRRAGKDPLSDTPLGNGGKVERGSVIATGGFRAV